MSALHEDMRAGDELGLLAEATDSEAGAARAQRGGGALRSRVVVALLTLGLLATALLISFVPRHSSAMELRPSLGPAALQEKVEAQTDGRTKLVVEQDLSKFITPASLPLRAVPGGGGSLVPQAATQLFEHVVHESGLRDELTHAELVAFKDRFIMGMIESDNANKYWAGDYIKTSQELMESSKPVMTKALAESWNKAQKGFTVKMEDWMIDESAASFQSRLGRKNIPKTGKLAERTQQKNFGELHSRDALPAAFDSREAWPECAGVIGKIHNQGRCGSCWTFGALGPLDSRLCIKTNATFSGDSAMLSRGFAVSCTVSYDGCQGGWEYFVYDYIEAHAGIPTTACNPYFAGEDFADHWSSSMPAPACPTQCDSRYTRSMADDWFKPHGIGAYRVVESPDDQGILDMKRAMYEGGPVPFAFAADNVFMGYSSGIFNHSCGQQPNHAVQAIGWGEGYILGQNSWGPGWGWGGRMKVAGCVVREFSIPGDIITGTEDYPLPVPTATFTTTKTMPPPIESTLPCVTLDDGCVTSPNYPEPYGNSQHCDIPYTIGKINVVDFSSERGYDSLTLNGQTYSGTHGPQGVVPTTNIVWSSDSSVTAHGWKICPTA
mmetsp:Transcript_58854/g.192006  ORF Transcript_58854/g.192006 Transcript_58854/m.192006 type:complete len:608 (-) Transcript_58854:487-2310(-)